MTFGPILSLAVLAGLSGVAGADEITSSRPKPKPLFTDVTRSHLPIRDLQGFSMDAARIDVDADRNLDQDGKQDLYLLCSRGGPDRLLMRLR